MQELVNLRNSTLSGSPLSPEAVGDRALRASQEAVQRAETGMEEATVLLRAAQEAAEMTDGSQGLAEVKPHRTELLPPLAPLSSLPLHCNFPQGVPSHTACIPLRGSGL